MHQNLLIYLLLKIYYFVISTKQQPYALFAASPGASVRLSTFWLPPSPKYLYIDPGGNKKILKYM